jgi:nucleoside 2-deoxyribosyltransferase
MEATMLIYFPAPLFSQAERAFNILLTEKLEEQGFSVFLPQRDGFERKQTGYNEKALDEMCQAIFTMDRDKVFEADILLAVLDDRVPDEGVCIEVALAYGQRHLLQRDKLLVGLYTDSRPAVLNAKLNAMVQGALDYIVTNEEDLFSVLEVHCADRNKPVELSLSD